MKSTERCITTEAHGCPSGGQNCRRTRRFGEDGWRMLRSEPEFNRLVSFVRSGLPLPLAQSVLSSLRKQGMPALDLYGRYLPIGSNQHVGPNDALDFHGAG